MTRNTQELIGRRVKSLKSDVDRDENDEERPIPVGATGAIHSLNHVDARGEGHYDVAWDNGAWTVYSESEVLTDLQLIEE